VGLKHIEYLSYYAQHFDTVEVDSTFLVVRQPQITRVEELTLLCNQGEY
jgi:uncharacterized protein YecE (DUF72 family)